MLRSIPKRFLVASGALLGIGLVAAIAADDWTTVPQRTRNPSLAQSGPELKAPQSGDDNTRSRSRGSDRDVPVPPPPETDRSTLPPPPTPDSRSRPAAPIERYDRNYGDTDRRLPPPPPPAPDNRYRATPHSQYRPAPAPDTRYRPIAPQPNVDLQPIPRQPVYSGEVYTPSRRYGLHIPGLLNVEVYRNKSTPVYTTPAPGPVAQQQFVTPQQVYSQTEILAKRLRDIHVYLHRQGVIENFQPMMNSSREALEAIKELSRKGFPLERIQAQFDAFDQQFHPLEERLYDAAAYDPTLRQMVDLVVRLEDDMHRGLNVARPW